jgi:hypothetical protein
MFKLSVTQTNNQRKLVLEGKLVAPWTEELESAWRQAQENLEGRKLLVDITNVILINRDGEAALFRLMREGARFICGGVLTKHLLRQLARRCHCVK